VFDSTIGRWQSKDPKSFDAGDTNLYRYVGNHPSYATDPSGLVENGPFRTGILGKVSNPQMRILESHYNEASDAGKKEEAEMILDSARHYAALKLGLHPDQDRFMGKNNELRVFRHGTTAGKLIDAATEGKEIAIDLWLIAQHKEYVEQDYLIEIAPGLYERGREFLPRQGNMAQRDAAEFELDMSLIVLELLVSQGSAPAKVQSLLSPADNGLGLLRRAPVRGLASTADGPAMEADRFARMRAAFERSGKRSIDTSPEAQMQMFELGGRGQTGLTLSADDVLMRPNPTASTFFDEMIHTAQFRNGRVANANSLYTKPGVAIDVLEFEVQRKLLKNASSYGLTEVERAAVRARALDIYKRLNNSGSGQTVRQMVDSIR